MNFKKIAAALLGAALLLTLLAGCNTQTVSPLVGASPDESAETTSSETTQDSAESVASLNISGAYASLDPDTVMLTVEGNDITWEELFCYINLNITQILSQIGSITDWSAYLYDEVTYEDYVLDAAVDYILQNAAINYGAAELEITLTDEDEQEIQDTWALQIESAGSEEDLIANLEAQYCTKEILMGIIRFNVISDTCLTQLYGENGSNLTDDEVAEYIAEDGYLMAKHILMLTTTTDDSGNETAMTDEEKAQVLETMEGILEDLNNYEGDDFGAYFDELMNTYTADPGVINYPDGYLFQSGEMVSEFEDATVALEIGQISEIVETDYGYHIIYRIPINYDVTPTAYSSYGTDSLRAIIASEMYTAVCNVWFDSLTVTYSDEYNALDFAELFAAG